MKSAAVIGGSSGIGLGIAENLINRGYFVYIIADQKYDLDLLTANDKFQFVQSDLRYYDETLFSELAENPDIEVLMITAGLGRVADFEYLHNAEIEKLMTINAESIIKIVHDFYHRIHSSTAFYCGIMGSIAGLISSPSFSVYAASKAAICRFIESINAELAVNGYKNRILNVSPGSIKGTSFNGGSTMLDSVKDLAEAIVSRMLIREELYIPDYEEVYKGVLERYHSNPQAFGISSYQYKKGAGRIINEKKVCIGYLSGTFDLFHVGHLNLLRRAKQQCDYLIVGVHNSGAWKGKETFIPFEERKEIVRSCRYVDKVVDSCAEDSDAWNLWHFNKLFVGSDYQGSERFQRYEEYFKDKGVQIVYFPYTKSTNSTQIRKRIVDSEKSGF